MRRLAPLAPLAAVGPVLFGIAAVVAPLLRPGHGILEESISSHAVGSYGWVQRSTFFALGLSSLVLALAVRSTTTPAAPARAGSALVAVWGVGAILGGTYPADDTYRSVHGVIATVSFIALALGILLLGRAFAADAAWRPLAGPTRVLGVTAALTGILTGATAAWWFGVSERLFIATALGWLVLAARHLGRVSKVPAAQGAAVPPGTSR
jgi:hypothetical membrane protein